MKSSLTLNLSFIYILLFTSALLLHQINAFVIASPSSLVRNNIKLHNNMDQNNNNETTQPATKTTNNIGTWNPLRLAVLKLKFTELKYTSPLNYEKRNGTYKCANCNNLLFDSNGKYDSGSGWPSFWRTANADRVLYQREWDGRVEIQCKNCRGHLGHVFPDGPMRKDVNQYDLMRVPEDDLKTSSKDDKYYEFTRLPRYCVNGASLKFEEK